MPPSHFSCCLNFYAKSEYTTSVMADEARKINVLQNSHERDKTLFESLSRTVRSVITPSWLTEIVRTVKESTKPEEVIKKEEVKKFVAAAEVPDLVPNSKSMKLLTSDALQHRQETFQDSTIQCPSPKNLGSSFQDKQYKNREDVNTHPFDLERCKINMVKIKNLENHHDVTGNGEDHQNKHYIQDVNKSQDTSEKGSVIKKVPFSNNPGFDITMFSSPYERRLSANCGRSHLSPFYSGKTRFGGALSQKSRLNSSAPNLNRVPYVVRQKIKAKARNRSSTTSAKRILETLQKISTPMHVELSDVRTEFTLPSENIERMRFRLFDEKGGKLDDDPKYSMDISFSFSSPDAKKDISNDFLRLPKMDFTFSNPIGVHNTSLSADQTIATKTLFGS